jgi:hypothetical protein
MGLAVAVTQDLATGEVRVYPEDRVEELFGELGAAALIIGFNVRRFDYSVLRGYRALDYAALPTLDLLEEIHATLGFRLSLNHLAQETLGAPKSADGLQSLAWWRAESETKSSVLQGRRRADPTPLNLASKTAACCTGTIRVGRQAPDALGKKACCNGDSDIMPAQ